MPYRRIHHRREAEYYPKEIRGGEVVGYAELIHQIRPSRDVLIPEQVGMYTSMYDPYEKHHVCAKLFAGVPYKQQIVHVPDLPESEYETHYGLLLVLEYALAHNMLYLTKPPKYEKVRVARAIYQRAPSVSSELDEYEVVHHPLGTQRAHLEVVGQKLYMILCLGNLQPYYLFVRHTQCPNHQHIATRPGVVKYKGQNWLIHDPRDHNALCFNLTYMLKPQEGALTYEELAQEEVMLEALKYWIDHVKEPRGDWRSRRRRVDSRRYVSNDWDCRYLRGRVGAGAVGDAKVV